MTSSLIIALDLEANDALKIARSLDPDKCNLKVGSQLFSSEGPHIINDLKKLGFNIFLDLKFHDIPNTVSLALKECIKMGVWMINVHALGGREMLLLASKTIEESEFKPILVGVTLLTSLTNSSLKNIKKNIYNAPSLSYIHNKFGYHSIQPLQKSISIHIYHPKNENINYFN